MLYASIALVAAGIALIAYSIMTRGRSRAESEYGHAAPRSENRGSDESLSPAAEADLKVRDDAHPLPEAVLPPVRAEAAVDREQEKPAVKPAAKPPAEAPAPVARQERTKASPAPASGGTGDPDTAVLYNDASGVVDYESRENVIDPSFKKYSKLRRIGRGHVGIVKDGINFQLRKKLYRFEFYRIEKMLPGKNYIALFIKGSDEAKLLIFDRESGIERRLLNEYNSYRKKAL